MNLEKLMPEIERAGAAVFQRTAAKPGAVARVRRHLGVEVLDRQGFVEVCAMLEDVGA